MTLLNCSRSMAKPATVMAAFTALPLVKQVLGAGDKRAMQFAQELNVQTIADLQAALDSGQIAALPRLGEKIAEALRIELQRLDTRSQRLPLAIALPAAEEVMRQLRTCNAVESIVPAGSIR